MKLGEKIAIFVIIIGCVKSPSPWTLKESGLGIMVHDFERISKDGLEISQCNGFKDPKLYEFIGFEFTDGRPESGKDNHIILRFKALEDISIEKVWGKVEFDGILGIWLQVWKGTLKLQMSFKKSDKVIEIKRTAPFSLAFSGNYRGTSKLYGNGGKEISCGNFNLHL